MIKKVAKSVFQWLAALLIGFFIVNTICFAYERPVGWADTDRGASIAVRNPGSLLVHGVEGYSFTKIDRYGYTNEDKPLQDSYILVMGTSHTQGKEIGAEKRYPDLMNQALSADKDSLYVFSIAADGNFLPSQIKHFNAAVTAYPKSSTVILEVIDTDYSADALNEACDQPDYEPSQTADIFKSYGTKDKLKTYVKEWCPLISMIKSHIETLDDAKKPGTAVKEYPGYEEAIDRALALIRSEYDGNIVFLYHPETILGADGGMELKYSSTYDLFKKACDKYTITIVDLGPAFKKEFDSTQRLPYGFSNTTPGSGHLNELGHRIAADELIRYLEATEK